MTNEHIKAIFLAAGFKEKDQGEGRMDLNPYVYDAARALLSVASRRTVLMADVMTAMQQVRGLSIPTSNQCFAIAQRMNAVLGVSPLAARATAIAQHPTSMGAQGMFKVRGDLIALFKAGHYDVIVHGQNCHCNWGDGIAKSIAFAFPDAVRADLQTKAGDASKLGTYSQAVLPQGVIINAYTQYDFYGVGPQGGPLAQYAAIREVFRRLRVEFGGQGKRFGIPAIGAARAGGDWSVISVIINQELAGENVTFVEFDGVDAVRGDYRRNMTSREVKP